MNKKASRNDAARRWLIFWTLFVGIGAVVGIIAWHLGKRKKETQ